MKVVLAFDSFKETMSSLEVANITKEELLKKYKDIDVTIIPISDGGEGSLDAISYSNDVSKLFFEVTGPHFERIVSSIINIDGDFYIESADVVGFKYKKEGDSPKMLTTYGIGELIKKALDYNPKSISICLGGTITNDGGLGMLSALGLKCYDNLGQEFIPLGESLKDIEYIDSSNIDERIFNTKVYALMDVTNPLYGKNGASYVFAKQKGADDEEIRLLDEGLINLSDKAKIALSKDYSNEAGSGAAGGLGFACLAFLKANNRSGIESIMDACNFNEHIINSDYVFTGEGRLDSQSFQGKAIMGIMNRVKKYNKKLIFVCGTISDENFEFDECIKGVYKTNYLNLDFQEAKLRCVEDLRKTINDIELD